MHWTCVIGWCTNGDYIIGMCNHSILNNAIYMIYGHGNNTTKSGGIQPEPSTNTTHISKCGRFQKILMFIHITCDDLHDDVIKWKCFPCYCPFVRGIHRALVVSPRKGQWRGALMCFFYLRLNKLLRKGDAGVWRRHRAHYDVTVMIFLHVVATLAQLPILNKSCQRISICRKRPIGFLC